jgi:hypothetical protein
MLRLCSSLHLGTGGSRTGSTSHPFTPNNVQMPRNVPSGTAQRRTYGAFEPTPSAAETSASWPWRWPARSAPTRPLRRNHRGPAARAAGATRSDPGAAIRPRAAVRRPAAAQDARRAVARPAVPRPAAIRRRAAGPLRVARLRRLHAVRPRNCPRPIGMNSQRACRVETFRGLLDGGWRGSAAIGRSSCTTAPWPACTC